MAYVVDDDAPLRQSLCQLLVGAGIPTLQFGDPLTFLDAFNPEAPACVVVDAWMPYLDGFELQERLRVESPAAKMIFCSANGNIEMSVRAMQRGAVTFLEKPYDSRGMLGLVQKTLETACAAFISDQRRQSVAARLATLTFREREVLRLVVEGLSSQQIAHRLGTSVKTIDVHRGRIKAKSAADSIGTLVHDILQNGAEI